MTCVHSLTPKMFVQTRHVLHEFCCYLARLNGNREGLDWVRRRLVESNLLLEPVTELHAISELVDEDKDLTEGKRKVHDDNSYGI
jgi:hypothetical protein